MTGSSTSDTSIWNCLACPECAGRIHWADGRAQCFICAFQRVQIDPRYLDLRPLRAETDDAWLSRQSLMESWYQNLARNQAAWQGCFHRDYQLIQRSLINLGGVVIDIGGGLGPGRAYIPSWDVYLIVDPSLMWLQCPPPQQSSGASVGVVRGFGEHLPVRSGICDSALALWSLNHTHDPARAIREAHRVLRPGGVFVAVLEDMAPSDADLREYPLLRMPEHPQEDHLPILERQFLTWLNGRFDVVDRYWAETYLVFSLRSK